MPRLRKSRVQGTQQTTAPGLGNFELVVLAATPGGSLRETIPPVPRPG